MPKKPIEPYAQDFRAALRVKVKSLADEARIIRREEERARSYHEWILLKTHRRTGVRREARHAQLALAFLRGTPYEAVEPYFHPGNDPDFHRVLELVLKYSLPPHQRWWHKSLRDDNTAEIKKRFTTWILGGPAGIQKAA